MSIGRVGGVAEARYSRLPSLMAGMLCLAAGAASLIGRFTLSVSAYLVALIVGCLLLFLQRRQAMRATRRASTSRLGRMGILERLAVWAVLGACVANGVVISLHLSRLQWGL